MCCENPEGVQLGSEEAEVPPSGCENPSPIQQVAYHMVNRRYSEFLNLQTRLEEKTEVRKLIKGRKDLDSFTQKRNLQTNLVQILATAEIQFNKCLVLELASRIVIFQV